MIPFDSLCWQLQQRMINSSSSRIHKCCLCCIKLWAFNKAFTNFFVAVTLNKEALSIAFFVEIFVKSLQYRLSDSAVHKFLHLPSHQEPPLIRHV